LPLVVSRRIRTSIEDSVDQPRIIQFRPDHQCDPRFSRNRLQLTTPRSAWCAPQYSPLFFEKPLFPAGQLHDSGRIPSGPLTTVAPPSNRESYELADFNAVGRPPAARPAETATARTQRFGSTLRSFEPSASSRSLAGLGSGTNGEVDWEKTASSEQRPRRGFRSTRLRFWAAALGRRAHRAKLAQSAGDLETTAKMKFSHSIQFNAVPDWSSNYIAYSNLKKL
jgi:hypothetical protein